MSGSSNKSLPATDIVFKGYNPLTWMQRNVDIVESRHNGPQPSMHHDDDDDDDNDDDDEMWTHPAALSKPEVPYPGRMEGWVDLGDWLHTEMVYRHTGGRSPIVELAACC